MIRYMVIERFARAGKGGSMSILKNKTLKFVAALCRRPAAGLTK